MTVCTVEEELALRLCATAAERRAHRDAVARLALAADVDRLLAFLARQRLVALAGTRFGELLPGELPAALGRTVAEHLAHNRHRGMLFSHLTGEVCGALDGAGIPVVPLKGADLAERVYGDLGLRSAQSDIDVLVSPDCLARAVEALEAIGYRAHDHVDWRDGLPHYHSRLVRQGPVEVWVEVHWRLHWYEERFAQEVLDRSVARENGLRAPHPVDELASLLLMFARDGYTGLRAPADIAAWWDRYGDDLPPAPLDGVISEHPRLAAAIVAAADVLEREVGVPVERLLDPATKRTRRTRLACRLAAWNPSSDEDESATDITLNDLLLTPRGAYGTFLRHYFWQPLDHYRQVYGWPREQPVRNRARRAVHAAGRLARTAVRYARRLWQLRCGISWAPAP